MVGPGDPQTGPKGTPGAVLGFQESFHNPFLKILEDFLENLPIAGNLTGRPALYLVIYINVRAAPVSMHFA